VDIAVNPRGGHERFLKSLLAASLCHICNVPPPAPERKGLPPNNKAEGKHWTTVRAIGFETSRKQVARQKTAIFGNGCGNQRLT